MQTQTIQIFPRGAMLTYSGDYYAPEGFTIYDGPERKPRKATPQEAKEIQINIIAQRYLDNEIHCNDRLVDELIRQDFEGFQTDDIRGEYVDSSEMTFAECFEYLSDEADTEGLPDVSTMPREVCIEMLRDAGIDFFDDDTAEELREAVIEAIDDETIEDILQDARDRVNEHSTDNPREVYEWYRVTPWLCEQLHAIGEVTIDNDWGEWWGRGCCGQSLIMDGTLQTIAAKFL